MLFMTFGENINHFSLFMRVERVGVMQMLNLLIADKDALEVFVGEPTRTLLY